MEGAFCVLFWLLYSINESTRISIRILTKNIIHKKCYTSKSLEELTLEGGSIFDWGLMLVWTDARESWYHVKRKGHEKYIHTTNLKLRNCRESNPIPELSQSYPTLLNSWIGGWFKNVLSSGKSNSWKEIRSMYLRKVHQIAYDDIKLWIEDYCKLPMEL